MENVDLIGLGKFILGTVGYGLALFFLVRGFVRKSRAERVKGLTIFGITFGVLLIAFLSTSW